MPDQSILANDGKTGGAVLKWPRGTRMAKGSWRISQIRRPSRLTAARSPADRLAKLWDAEGKPIRAFEPMAELVTREALSHDGARVAAGDWSGQVRLWNTADGKPVALLAANPPTLQMAAEAARVKSAAADAAAQKAVAELADASAKLAVAKKELVALEKLHAQKATAAKSAADAVSAAKAAAEKAAAEKAAFDKAPKPAK